MDWTISILFLAIGCVVGFVVAKLLGTKATSDGAAEAKSQRLEAELAQYKDDVELHFADSANLLGNMAQEYSKVYKHMVQAQRALLPDSDLTIKIPFVEPKEPSLVKEALEEVEIEVAANEAMHEKSAQPNDYVSGSHGIINPETMVKSKEQNKESA